MGEPWRVVVAGDDFARFARSLHEYEQVVLDAILKLRGEAGSRGGKMPVLLRVFCAFERGRVVLLLGGYDKLKDSSVSRQQREIAAAGRVLAEWKRQPRP